MGDVTTEKMEELTEWERYYPKAHGWNDEWDEADRWWVDVRRTPSRRQARKMRHALQASEDIREQIDLFLLCQHFRGPHNLTINGEPPDTVMELIEALDSSELADELANELGRRIRVTEEEAGNSDAPSGGDTSSPGGADPRDDETTTGGHVQDVSATPAPEYAPGSTTQSVPHHSTSGSPQDRENGDVEKTRAAVR